MNKKLLALLITILVMFSLCMVACEEVHSHNYVEVAAKDPTCTQKGNALYYTCSGCAQLFDADKNSIDAIPEVDAKGHTYVEHTACEAKCEQAGNPLYYTCEKCDVIFDANKAVVDQIPVTAALGHDYGTVSYVWATDNSTCTATRTCSRDESHVETETATASATVTQQSSCTTDELTTYVATFENSAFAKQTKENIKTAEKGEHNYTKFVSYVTEPTCTDEGSATYKCAGCTETTEKKVDALGHQMTHHEADSATCTEVGTVEYYACSRCNNNFSDEAGATKLDSIVVAALGHQMTHHEADSATCTEKGTVEYYACSRCNNNFSDEAGATKLDSIVADALGHDYENHVAVSATCTEVGNDEYYTCKNCDVIFDATKKVIDKIPTIAAKGHTYAWTDAVENVSTLKCACGDAKGSVNVSVDTRLLVDVDATSLEIDVADFGTGLTVKSVKLGENTVTELTANGTKVTLATASLVKDVAHGDHNATIAVAIGDSATINVTLPVRVAYTISDVEGLKALYTVTDHDTYSNPVVGGTVVNGIVTQYWYVLTADIDGAGRLGDLYEYGSNDESWYTSGNAKQGFVGVFDGQKHTIKNFKIVGHGFFGHVGCGTIQNVNFTNIELAAGSTSLIGKLVDSTIQNVNVSNITIGTLSENSGILGYHQLFSATLKNVDIDLTGITTATNVFCKVLDDSNMWGLDNSSFENVTVKLDSTSGIKFFADKAVTESLTGVTVSFVPFTVAKPVANTQDFYYTGSELTYTLATSAWYTISGNKQTAVGTYTVTVSLLDFEGISWADNTTDDLTFTFEIKEFPIEMVNTAAAAFTAKVTALGTPVYPRDIAAIQSVLADYEALNALVKDHDDVVAAKATLDGYKTECDKWEEVSYTYASNHIITKFSGYDSYYLVMYNPTDTDEEFYYSGNGDDWSTRGSTTLVANKWTQSEYKKADAEAGDGYCYVAGDPKKFGTAGSGWILKIYGKKPAAGTTTVALSVNGTVDVEIEGQNLKVRSVHVPANQQYLEGWGHMTTDQLAELAKYSNLYVYVYNPLEEDVQFFLQDDIDWIGHCNTTLKAQSWTKVALDLSAIPAGYGVYVDVSYKPTADSTGWMISDFYGVAAE